MTCQQSSAANRSFGISADRAAGRKPADAARSGEMKRHDKRDSGSQQRLTDGVPRVPPARDPGNKVLRGGPF